MIAYYVHWHYPASADDANSYAGRDDDKLFHHKENAEKYAKDQISEWNDNSARFEYLDVKDSEYGLSPQEREEYDKLVRICCGDLPNDYAICERDIKFEDDTIHNTPNKRFFTWIYERLLYVHRENPNIDYMLSLKQRIEELF